jgi:hypothetical protein
MLDILQIKQLLDSFSDTPTRYCKEFFCLTWALTWGVIYNIIINDTLMEDEEERIWKAAEQHADQLHEQHPNRHPPPLRQYQRLSLSGAFKMKTPPSFLITSWMR